MSDDKYVKGEVLLALMSDEQIQSVVDSVRSYGSSITTRISNLRRESLMPARWFELMDNGTASAEELNAMLHGLTLVFFSAANKAWDETAYADLLISSLGMDPKQAAKVAKSIDTEDVFSFKDASWTDRFKRLYNWIVPEFMEAEYNSAHMDIDLPWEMLQLGRAIISFLHSTKFSRNKFLSALTPASLTSGDLPNYEATIASRVLPLALRMRKDPVYGDIFDSLLSVVKSATNVLPVGNVIKNIANVASSVYGSLTGQSQTNNMSANAITAKVPVQPEIKSVSPQPDSGIPLVYLKRDSYGPIPIKS